MHAGMTEFMTLEGVMKFVRIAAHRAWCTVFVLGVLLSLTCPYPSLALEEILVSYAGPSVTFLPAEVGRQRGFFREQNLDIKLLLTRSEVDRAALVSGSLDYTLRAGSSFVSAARGDRSGAWSFDPKSNRSRS
jgi:ABC-type nitrate/sulfonate/bicarbonate transport system substrate-binding protein